MWVNGEPLDIDIECRFAFLRAEGVFCIQSKELQLLSWEGERGPRLEAPVPYIIDAVASRDGSLLALGSVAGLHTWSEREGFHLTAARIRSQMEEATDRS